MTAHRRHAAAFALTAALLASGCRGRPANAQSARSMDRRGGGATAGTSATVGTGPLATLPIEPGVEPIREPTAVGVATTATAPPATSPPSSMPSSTPTTVARSTTMPAPPATGSPCVETNLDGSGFAPDSWELPASLRAELDTIIGWHFTHIELVGHTDPRPTHIDIDNYELSQRRADAVSEELIRRGVPTRIIETRGVGAREPRHLTDDEPDYPADRRVALRAWCTG